MSMNKLKILLLIPCFAFFVILIETSPCANRGLYILLGILVYIITENIIIDYIKTKKAVA